MLGLRGAIPYALSLHLGLEPIEKRQLIGTTTIIIVLFTILFLGAGTKPLIRIMDIEESQSRRKNKKDVNLSKTQKMVMKSKHHFFLTIVGLLSTSMLAGPSPHLQLGPFHRVVNIKEVECGFVRRKLSQPGAELSPHTDGLHGIDTISQKQEDQRLCLIFQLPLMTLTVDNGSVI